ncbi:MAG: hypothetical protein QMD65_03100 [Patescibacteria group bacterium]|nr:hypothetical protein [Patescibacteria group bacterium]
MISIVLFWCGVVATFVVGFGSWYGKPTETKRGTVAFPFALLLAAAVARYLGM